MYLPRIQETIVLATERRCEAYALGLGEGGKPGNFRRGVETTLELDTHPFVHL